MISQWNVSSGIKYRRNAIEAVEYFLNKPEEAIVYLLSLEFLLKRRSSLLKELLAIQIKELDRS